MSSFPILPKEGPGKSMDNMCEVAGEKGGGEESPHDVSGVTRPLGRNDRTESVESEKKRTATDEPTGSKVMFAYPLTGVI